MVIKLEDKKGKQFKLKGRSGLFTYKDEYTDKSGKVVISLVGPNGGTYTVSPDDLVSKTNKRSYNTKLPEDLKVNIEGDPKEVIIEGVTYKVW